VVHHLYLKVHSLVNPHLQPLLSSLIHTCAHQGQTLDHLHHMNTGPENQCIEILY
jgi:hypothetical protein